MAEEALVLTGPTASGKTGLAVAIAQRLDGEIISADSRQVYRGMDIGTAKATPAERAAAPHHGLDLVDPATRYSAGRFARDARRWIEEIRGRGRVPILVGGTGFFIRALTHPLFREPPLDPERRRRLHAFLLTLDEHENARWLEVLDPGAAARIGRPGGGGGRQRAFRALEVVLLTGRPLDWWHRHQPPSDPPLRAAIFVLDLPRSVLDDRINARVEAMFEAGLEEEVRRLLESGYRTSDPGMSATGYPETAALVRGEIDREAAKDRIRRATRRYARRQLTWFRNQLPAGAVWLDGTRPMERLVEEVVERWETAA
jgi:tRNA dimethylallyltransferase